MKTIAILCSLVALAGCDRLQKPEVEEFNRIASECLLDVRDRNVPFAQSRYCVGRLEQASFAVMNKYGGQDYVALSAEGRATAWSALALSNGMYRQHPAVLRLW